MVEEYGIKIVPINIVFDRKIYRDGIDLSAADAYKMLREKPELFYSSPASAGEYAQAFKQAAQNSDRLFCITLSTKLSSMYNMAKLAISQVKEQLPNIAIELLDSQSATTGEGLVVEKAAKAAAEGKSLVEVRQATQEIIEKTSVIGVMETIRNVYRTGRIPKLAARFGASLNIRPIFVIAEGKVKVVGITKSQQNGITRVLKMMKEKVGDKPINVAIAHADALEAGEGLTKKIQTEFNCVEIWLTDFSPVMAYATGAGVLAIGYYLDEVLSNK
jgi:DegV family protein with EDD domain